MPARGSRNYGKYLILGYAGSVTTELSNDMSYDSIVRMLISATVATICLTKLDELMSGDNLYPVMRPLIASCLLYSAYKATSVEPAG